MIQEDQDQLCSNGSSSSFKKLKQRKVPQRGLGVAQLERIRIEEQQNKDTRISPPPKIISPTHNNSSSLPTILHPISTQNNDNDGSDNNKITSSKPYNYNCPPLSQPTQPPRPAPPPPPLPPPRSSPMFRTTSVPSVENLLFDSLVDYPSLLSMTDGNRGCNVGRPSLPVNGNVNVPKLWHHPHELNIDYHNAETSSFLQDLLLPIESCSTAPLTDLLPKWTQCKRQQLSTSMVNNVSSTNSMNYSSSSSLSWMNFPMKPPSNQNYPRNCIPLWPDDEKVMLGTKRQCPFPLDDPPIPIFRNKFPTTTNNVLSRKNESTSNGGTTYELEPPIFRDFPACSSVIPDPTTYLTKRNGLSNGKTNGGLLSLAPPATTSSSVPNPVLQQSFILFRSNDNDNRNFVALPCQENLDARTDDLKQADSSPQRNCFSFFPSTGTQTISESQLIANHTYNKNISENVDLNLRL